MIKFLAAVSALALFVYFVGFNIDGGLIYALFTPHGTAPAGEEGSARFPEPALVAADEARQSTAAPTTEPEFGERSLADLPPCAMPAPPAAAQVILYRTASGEMISSTAVGGQDQETFVSTVEIEPGDQPLYLVLSSNASMVWRVTGAVNRLAYVAAGMPGDQAVSPGVSPVGVSGVQPARVTILDRGCLPQFGKMDTARQTVAYRAVERALGRAPDLSLTVEASPTVHLPSGKLFRTAGPPPAPPGFDRAAWSEAFRGGGGVLEIDPATVVSPAPVEAYLVLPHQAGIAQLLGRGELERTRSRFDTSIQFRPGPNGPEPVVSPPYRVIKPIAHLPPAMTGARAANMVVAEGVPLPPGDPGHACIYLEGQAEAAQGVGCRAQ